MTIYLITGFTYDIGLWEVEIFTDKDEAVKQFKYYVDERNAKVDALDEWLGDCGQNGYFYLERRKI